MDNISIVSTKQLWLEDSAIQQLRITAQLPHIQAAVGLPDLHPGRGYPVGAAFFSVDHFYTALVGGDIGCGMALWKTRLRSHKASAQKMVKQLGDQDGPLPETFHVARAESLGDVSKVLDLSPLDISHVGTIGGGNHFVEFLVVDTLYDDGDANIDKKAVYLLVHSGSRGLGGLIGRAHIDAHGHKGLNAASADAAAYLRQHNGARRYARVNRHWIAQRFLHAVRTEGDCLLDVDHNHVVPYTYQGVTGWLHRKGATPATEGLVMIPGSRGDYSYLVEPLPEVKALQTLAHGAGRKWARSDCEGRLSARFRAEDLRKTALGSSVVCGDKALLFEEAPQAYKEIDAVMQALVEHGLVRIVARFKPLLTYKKSEASCCPGHT